MARACRRRPSETRAASEIAVPAAVAFAAVLLTGATAGAAPQDRVARGKYLVTLAGCNDCHTPLKMGQNGPEPDWSRLLSGHPEQMKLPPAPARAEGPWGVAVASTLTAWSGPWGTSFPANLTPDEETGLGRWTEKDFVATLRTGRHLGRGRQILPPMPWFNYAQMTDEDLASVFAYLQSIPAIKNKVPAPVPPTAAPTASAR